MGNMEDGPARKSDTDPDTKPRTMRSDVFRINVSAVVALLIACVPVLVWLTSLTPPSSESIPDYFVPTICFVLVYWPIYVAIYLGWTHRVYSSMNRGILRGVAASDIRRNRSWVGRWSGLGRGGTDLTTTAATVSVLVTIAIAVAPGFPEDTLVIILTMLMVAASWAMMVYGFALDYMRMTITQDPEETPHIVFENTDEPEFSDFLTVSVMASTMGSGLPADITSQRMWRRLRTHSILAFFFNTVIVAMMVSLIFGGITSD